MQLLLMLRKRSVVANNSSATLVKPPPKSAAFAIYAPIELKKTTIRMIELLIASKYNKYSAMEPCL